MVCPEQAQVVAHERSWDADPRGDLANRPRLLQTGEQDAQPRRLAHEPEDLGGDGNLFVAERRDGVRNRLHDNVYSYVSMSVASRPRSKPP